MILDNRGIGCIAEELVEEIMNRAGTDLCPFEKRIIDIDDPEEGYQILNKVVKGHFQQAS